MAEFLGRFHPLIVHLPIGILLMGIFLMMLDSIKTWSHSREIFSYIYLCGMITSWLAVLSGWFVSELEEHPKDILQYHLIMGFTTALLATVSYVLIYLKADSKWIGLIQALLLLSIIFTGHFGGSLTHGDDYLMLWKKPSP